MVLAIKTDQPTAKLYLLSEDGQVVGKHQWLADRQLADSLLRQISKLLKKNKFGFDQLKGIVVFAGPGSFTGLRIGITVANSLAYGINVSIVGTKGDSWVKNGLKKLKTTKPNKYVIPEYGALPNITRPKH